MLNKLEDRLVELDWKQANDNVLVKLLVEENELYVLAKSKDRRAKERAIRKYKLRKYLLGLARLRKNWLTQVEAAFKSLKSDLAVRPG